MLCLFRCTSCHFVFVSCTCVSINACQGTVILYSAKKLFLWNQSLSRSSFNAVCKEFVEVDAGHIHGDTYCWLSRVHLFIQCVFPGYDRGILETQWWPSRPTGSNVRLFWRVFRDPTENWGAESFWRRGRGRDESIICGSRRCIATVTLHMYTSPECNTVWTV